MTRYASETNPQENKIDQITEYLFLSNWYMALRMRELKKHNIRAILCICECDKPQHVLDSYAKHDIDAHYICLDDDGREPISHFFEEACVWITKHVIQYQERVLIHCAVGMSRSPTLLLSYLVHCTLGQVPVHTLVSYVQGKRSIVRPNDGFLGQLRTLQRDLQDTSYSKKHSYMDTNLFRNEFPHQNPFPVPRKYASRGSSGSRPHTPSPVRSSIRFTPNRFLQVRKQQTPRRRTTPNRFGHPNLAHRTRKSRPNQSIRRRWA